MKSTKTLLTFTAAVLAPRSRCAKGPSTLVATPVMTHSRFLRYASVGVAATVLHYAVLVAGTELAGWHPAMASALGAVCGAVLSYACNRRFTFASAAPHREAFPRFVAIALLGAGMNALVVALGTIHFGWHYLIAQLLATLLVLLGGFALNRSWTFA